nr:F-box domain, leucine-rich repeat domain, L domain-like protein [Tanacetum cinerariifolium]
MSTDVARSHDGDGDGGGEDYPPQHYVPTGYGGCFANRGKGKRKPNLGGMTAGRLNTRDKTRNLSLKEITNTKGPVPIRFEVRDKQTLMPLGEHATHWSSYIGETQFDLRPHMESPDWTEIHAGIQHHLQKAYNTNKAAFKAHHWVIDPTTGTYNVEKIRRARHQDIMADEWDKYIQFWNDPKNISRATQNRQNRAKSTEYLSLIDTFFVAHTVNEEFLQDEDRRIYEEMRRLEATGTYTDDEINHLDRGGKQRGHIPGVGRVLPARATASPNIFSQFESGGASGSGGCGDDKESADDQDDEHEDGDGDISLGIVAGEGIPVEHSPANIPQRQVARKRFSQQLVAGKSHEMSLGNVVNVVVNPANLNITLTKLMEQMTLLTSFCEMACQIVQKKQEEKQLEEEQAAKAQNWKLPVCYDDDDDEERSNSLKDNIISGLPPCSSITPNEPVLSTEEPDNSLSIGDEHLDTILAMESDEFIKSSGENLIPIPSESEGILEHMCDVPFHDNSPPLDILKDQFEDFSESNDEFSSTDDDSFSIDKIDYVEASPPDYELVSSEVMEIVIPEVGGIDDAILLTINDDILRENLLNVNHLFAKIEALNDNPILFYDPIVSGTPPTLTPFGESDFFLEETKSSSTSLNSLLEKTNTFDNSLPESDTLCFDVEEISSGSTTTRFDISLPAYEASYDDQSFSNEDVSEKIFLKPLFKEEIIPMKIDPHPDNVESDLMESLCTHDSSLIISSKIDSLLDEFADELALLKSIPPGINKTDCDPEEDIRLIERLLYDKSSPHGNTGILNIKMMGDISDQKAFIHKLMITLASHQEKSLDLLSHRGLKAFQPSATCPMMIHGKNNPILDVLLFHFYPP